METASAGHLAAQTPQAMHQDSSTTAFSSHLPGRSPHKRRFNLGFRQLRPAGYGLDSRQLQEIQMIGYPQDYSDLGPSYISFRRPMSSYRKGYPHNQIPKIFRRTDVGIFQDLLSFLPLITK
jgi:hypothetical protein